MKKFQIMLIGVLLSFGAVAQNTDPTAIRSRIREVKLSEQYAYCEGTSTTSPAEANEMAVEGLLTEANRILSEMGKSKEEKNPLLKLIDEKKECLSYQNGPLYKVFVFVPLGLITGQEMAEAEAPTEPVKEEVTPVEPVKEEVVSVEPVKEEIAPVEPVKEEVVPVEPAPILEMKTGGEEKSEKEKQAELASNMALSQAPLDTERQAERIKASERQFTASAEVKETMIKLMDMAETKTKTPPEVPNLTKELSPLDTTNPTTYKVLNSLLKMDSYESVMLYLDSMKDDGRVMFGKLSTLKAPEKAYFIIMKDGKLVTILNKGGRERVNLKTNEPELITKYIGYGVIWLHIF